MFSEKNIPKLIILTPIITVILIAFFTIYFFVKNQNDYFKEESLRVESEYILKQKNILKKETNTVISYLKYHKNKEIKEIKNSMQNNLNAFSKQIDIFYNDKYSKRKEKKVFIKNLISLKQTNDSFYFAYDVENNIYIEANDTNLKNDFLRENKDIKNYLYPGTGEFVFLQNKIIYIKYISKLNWIIVLVQDTKEKMQNIKDDLINYIETLRYENNGYIWIHDTSYYLVSHPFRQKSIGSYDIALKDATGTLITKKFIDETLKSPDGTFIEYNWVKPNEKEFSKKLGFFKLYEDFSWVIGSGLYMDDIEKTINQNKDLLEQRVNKYITLVIIISIFVIFVIGIISLIVSNKINKVFFLYRKKVKTKELLLENMNKTLELKVQKAIKDVQKKDRAMLHQSRLARMGVMLSMIAHQWRQPLSKVSALLMELETATKFKKVDEELIFRSVDESNKLLYYMSNTIDDFRNFFKPDKQKVDFYINDACDEVISLTSASIQNLQIDFEVDIKDKIMISGYKREFAQVLLNLITNAKDVLKDNNILNPKIILSVKKENEFVNISVQDNALGVKEENLDLIFEPYFTTKEKSKGTGLGLYMSKMIIEKNMDGELSVRNINNGAKFTICLKV